MSSNWVDIEICYFTHLDAKSQRRQDTKVRSKAGKNVSPQSESKKACLALSPSSPTSFMRKFND